MSIISAVHLNITYANSFKSRNVLHPADAAVAGPILKIARATHGKPASRKLRNTLLGYIKKQQIVEFMLLHSKNALEMISEDPNIQKISGGTCPLTGPMPIFRE